jgi:hypothetical protein
VATEWRPSRLSIMHPVCVEPCSPATRTWLARLRHTL